MEFGGMVVVSGNDEWWKMRRELGIGIGDVVTTYVGVVCLSNSSIAFNAALYSPAASSYNWWWTRASPSISTPIVSFAVTRPDAHWAILISALAIANLALALSDSGSPLVLFRRG